ncbi:MAG: flagellar basal body protein [Fibrobacterota bacterium]
MDTSFAISNSGLSVTQIRHDVTANNVANINTDGFGASRVSQNDENPGVSVGAIRKTPNVNPNGPSNTDFAVEAGEMINNKNVYGANARVFKVQDKMVGELIDLLS